MERLDLFNAPELGSFDRRLLPPLTRREYGAAVALWLIAAAAAFAVNFAAPPQPAQLGDIAFFVVLYLLAVVMSASLPASVYVARLSTTVMLAAAALGVPQALIVGVIGGTIAAITLPSLRFFLGISSLRRTHLLFSSLWNAGMLVLPVLPAWVVYRLLGGVFDTALNSVANYALFALFALTYFLSASILLVLWMLLRGVAPRDYLRPYVLRDLLLNGLIPMFFAPVIAAMYYTWPNLRFMGLIAFVLVGLLFYSTTRATTTLATRLAELRVLNRIGQALNTTLDMDSLVEVIHREINALMDTSGMYLALVHHENGMISFPLIFDGESASKMEPRPFSNGLTEYIIHTRKPLMLVNGVHEEARILGINPIGPDPKSYVGVPIMAGEKVLGVLALRDFLRMRVYSKSDVQLLETIANQAAVAISNAQLFQRSQRQMAELAALHKVSLMASATLGLDEILRTICNEAVRIMPFQKVAVFLLDDDGVTLNMVKSAGLSESYIEWSQGIDMNASLRTSVLQTGEPLAIGNIASVPRFAEFVDLAHGEGFSAFLDLPLFSGTTIIGSMTAYYEKPHIFDPSEMELLQTLGGQIVIAVENARLFDEMQARTAELAMLYDASTVINASLSLKNVLRAVAISMIQALQTKSCLALVAMEDGQELRAELLLLAGAEGILDDNLAEFSVMVEALPKVQAALRRQQPIVLHATSEDLSPAERSLLMQTAAQSVVVVPLVARNEPVGLIISGTPDGQHTYMIEQLRLAEALANQAAVAIENAVLFERTDIALSKRLDEITSLELISQRMTRRLDLQSVIEHVMHAAKAATSSEFGEVALYDENSNYLRIAARRNEIDDSDIEMEWAATSGICGRAIRTGQPVLVDDVETDPDYHPARRAIRSELVVPIVLEGRRLGLINLESTRLAAFNLDHLRFVTNLAEHAAIAIQNARLFETVQHRAEEFNTLRSIAVDLLSSSDVKQALQVIARGAMERTHSNSVHIYLYNERDNRLTFGASLWSTGEQDLELTPPRSNGLTMSVARSGERIVIANARQHPMFNESATATTGWSRSAVERLGAIIGVPLKRGNEVIGVFNIGFEESAAVSDDVLRFLDFLAAQASVAIANAGLQEETRTNRDLLQAILDSSHDGIIMADIQGRLVMANSRAEYLLNTHMQDCLGRPLTTVLRQLLRASGTRSAFTDREAHDMARRLKENPNQITRRRYVFPQPQYQAIEESSLPVMDDNNMLLGRVFILRDITQEVELESFRQEMSHMLVHDLRSPLGGVITGVHTALDEIEMGMEGGTVPDLPMVQTMLGVALSSGQSLLRLVESILDIHRMETGEMPLNLDVADLGDLADRARTTLENTARSGAITVAIDVPADLPPIRVDGEKIERVMINLLDNALRYTPQGGNVWITIERGEGSQTFTVRDNGDGVPQELWNRIFDRFVQADTTRRKRGSKGSGLGLTFCKLAVEAHGGHIWVDRAPEGGAAFHFMLPT